MHDLLWKCSICGKLFPSCYEDLSQEEEVAEILAGTEIRDMTATCSNECLEKYWNKHKGRSPHAARYRWPNGKRFISLGGADKERMAKLWKQLAEAKALLGVK
jgi:hypothetical protein